SLPHGRGSSTPLQQLANLLRSHSQALDARRFAMRLRKQREDRSAIHNPRPRLRNIGELVAVQRGAAQPRPLARKDNVRSRKKYGLATNPAPPLSEGGLGGGAWCCDRPPPPPPPRGGEDYGRI